MSIKHRVRKKDYIWNSSTCETDEYLKSIIGDSVIACDEIIDAVAKSDTIPINLNDKKPTYKMDYHYILHTFS